jgi:hypothetical protein
MGQVRQREWAGFTPLLSTHTHIMVGLLTGMHGQL